MLNAEYEFDEDQNNIFNLQASDVDASSVINFIVVEQPLHGQVTLENTSSNTGTIFYYPNSDFNGQDSFTYQAIDETNLYSNIGTILLNILPVNDAPAIETI